MSEPDMAAVLEVAHGEDGAAASLGGGAGLVETVLHTLNSIGSAWIFLIMLLVCADVVARSFLNAPIDGVAEMAGLSVVAIVFLQLGATIHGDRMTRADYLRDFLGRHSRPAAHLVEALLLAASCAMLAVLAHACWPPLAAAWIRHEFLGVEGVFTVPTWPVPASQTPFSPAPISPAPTCSTRTSGNPI